MRVAAASITLLLDIIHVPARGQFAVAPDDASAAERGETEKTNETAHDTLPAAAEQIAYPTFDCVRRYKDQRASTSLRTFLMIFGDAEPNGWI